MTRWRQPDLDGIAAGKEPVVECATPLEGEVSTGTRRSLARHPAVQQVWRMNSGAHVRAGRFIRYHTVPGLSDLWVLLKPRYGTRFAFIELKRLGKDPTTEQRAFLEVMRERGHVAFAAHSEREAWKLLTIALKEARHAIASRPH